MPIDLTKILSYVPLTNSWNARRETYWRLKIEANKSFLDSTRRQYLYTISELQQKLEEAGIVRSGLVGKLQTEWYMSSLNFRGRDIDERHYLGFEPVRTDSELKYRIDIYLRV